MAIGERIRWFRKRHGLTQRELGLKLGFTNKTADLRIRQYETGLRNPKEGTIKDLAQVFDVAEEALAVPDIDSYIGLMHTLFTLEDLYGLFCGSSDCVIVIYCQGIKIRLCDFVRDAYRLNCLYHSVFYIRYFFIVCR